MPTEITLPDHDSSHISVLFILLVRVCERFFSGGSRSTRDNLDHSQSCKKSLETCFL
jgi:hypothetical protein